VTVRDDDRGDTLLELLVAVVIMGIAAVAIFGALLASVKVSDYHRKQTSAGAAVHNLAEKLTQYIAAGYTACATTAAYSPATVGYATPAGFTAATTSVLYWIGGVWTPSGCTAATDTGVQQVAIQVSSSDGRATEFLRIVVRKPCGPGSTCA
jgi:type II secretory pathway pseudopilin PulG